MPSVIIDGVETVQPEGSTILAALTRLGLETPALCHDDRLVPTAKCRACVVEVGGHLVPSCSTRLVEGMRISTRSPLVEDERRGVLRLLAERHPRHAVESSPDKPLHRWLRVFGLEGECHGEGDGARVDESNPYIRVDMALCIHCDRCVRICDEVQGQHVWRVQGRGDERHVVVEAGQSLRSSACVSCGACVSACPTGALEDKTRIERGTPDRVTRTVCPYCGVGCEMLVGSRDGRIVEIMPALDAPVNKGHLCSKGRYAFDFVASPDRVTTPMIRDASGWKQVSWPEAVAFTAARLEAILRAHGPGAVGLLGSARATNEENYALQKLARVALGTNNVDCCARVCHAPSAKALSTMLGTGAATNCFDDIERARTILVCGANATENHPVVGARIKQQAARGANLIVIDPRPIELARLPGAIHLAVRPGANVALLNAIAAVIVDEGLVDQAFVAERVDGLSAFAAVAQGYLPERVEALTGVPAGLVRRAARLYAQDRPSMAFHGLGVTEHAQGTEGVMAIVNLALLTGNIGRPGSGVNPLRGQNNVQGSAHMGCEPSHLAGYQALDQARARFEQVWGAKVPEAPGLDLLQMIDAARAGALNGLWMQGYDVLLTNPELDDTRRALAKLDLIVVQDIFVNESARELGHVFFPSACSYEKDGTFMNAERRVQRVRAAVPPPGEARPDWAAVAEVARALGHGELFAWPSAEAIWEEIRRVWPAGAGISYARLDDHGLQWPCPSEDHPGTERLHEGRFPLGPRASLRPLPWLPTTEQPSEQFPFVLGTGRSLYHFNAGTMTMRTPQRELRPTDRLELGPDDARRLGLADGERAIVRSRHGEAVLPVSIREGLQPGYAFATFQDPTVRLNRVVSGARDPYTHTPEYKVTAVQIEKLGGREAGATAVEGAP